MKSVTSTETCPPDSTNHTAEPSVMNMTVGYIGTASGPRCHNSGRPR